MLRLLIIVIFEKHIGKKHNLLEITQHTFFLGPVHLSEDFHGRFIAHTDTYSLVVELDLF